jgi:putative endonuclease
MLLASPAAMPQSARSAMARRGEQLAEAHYQRLGFSVLARNHRTRHGEIDLIVYDGHTLAFVEVKTRCSGAGHPFDAIHPGKQRQVRRMAREWLAAAPWVGAADLRFDAVGVRLDARGKLVRLDHVEAAF